MAHSIITTPRYAAHRTPLGHPECSLRWDASFQALQQAGLVDQQCLITPAAASYSQLCRTHTAKYVDLVAKESSEAAVALAADGSLYLSTGDVSVSPDAFAIAALAAGGAIAAVDAVFSGVADTAFALVRPPGHHATRAAGMGFCLLNNIAVAARHAQSRYGVERMLIVDWDVHHGNGTQDIFYDDPCVYYFSTHQWPLYPGTGASSETGVGAGLGSTINIPIAGGTGSREAVLRAFEDRLPEVAEECQPELILISAGFDAHVDDPLGGLDLTTEDFGLLTERMRHAAERHCNGRLVSVLEGGYNLAALGASVAAHVAALE